MDVQRTSRQIETPVPLGWSRLNFSIRLRHSDTDSAMYTNLPMPNGDNGNLPPPLEYPSVYAGDFNSHHEDWGYKTANDDGSMLANWTNEMDQVRVSRHFI